LRLALHRRAILQVILATWPDNPAKRNDDEWAALRAALPAGTASAEIRNRTRQIRAWSRTHNGRLPLGLMELEPLPRCASAPPILLAAADKQLATLTRTSTHTARLRVQLPLNAAPPTAKAWAWHIIDLRLPPTVSAEASLAAPTLRLVDMAVRVDLPYNQQVPIAPSDGHTVALGFDWGVNTLLTGSIGRLDTGAAGSGSGGEQRRRVISDGRMLRFDATPISAKLHRLHRNRETVAARRDRYLALLGGLPATHPHQATLQQKLAGLDTEHERICARIRHLNHALAWVAARWATDQALALGATVIYLEDLATLEARGHRGAANARLSGQIRGTLLDAIRHLAAKAGIAVVTVPARGTSKYCPRCLGSLHHAPAPDRADQHGWKWAVCPRCGLSNDRDHAAAERIVARGLLAQRHTLTNRKTGARTIRISIDRPVARARRPKRQSHANRAHAAGSGSHRRPQSVAARRHGPIVTPRKGRPTFSRLSRTTPQASTFHRALDQHAVPAPAPRNDLAAGKRPAGPAPQTHLWPMLESRPGPACCSLPSHSRSQARLGAGWGFHRTVRATEVLLLGHFGPGRHGYASSGSLSLARQARVTETLFAVVSRPRTNTGLNSTHVPSLPDHGNVAAS